MNALTITYIIGTENIGVGAEEIAGVEAYQTELQEKLKSAFPEARHVDVVIDNGYSQARIEGYDADDYEKEEAALEQIKRIADEVWNHGEWHNAQ